jgi:hypothetical protein
MINFIYRNGFSSVNHFLKMKLISPLEPIIMGLFIIFFLFVIIYFHISGFFVYSEFSSLPLRQKLSIAIILFLSFGALYWAFVENAKFLVERRTSSHNIRYYQPPVINLETKKIFSTLIDSIDKAESEYYKMVRLGYNFRTVEIELFKENLENLKSKYIVELSKFEVKLISEPKIYTNYSENKIISANDLLIDLTFSIKNLNDIPKVFPLRIELSSVMGNHIVPIQGHKRLSKTTFNSGVRDYFTLTYPVNLEDRPDRIVVKKEFLLRANEKFIEFGPGTPLQIGDIFSAKEGLIYVDKLSSTKTGEVKLYIDFLSSSNSTKEIEFSDCKKIIEKIFLVTKNGKTYFLNDFIGNYSSYSKIVPNEIMPFELIYQNINLSIEDVKYIIIKNKKILKTTYKEKEEVKKLCIDYMSRIAAASEFEVGIYYLNPPIYRRWAKDTSEARKHFKKALKLFPESLVIKNAVKLTNEEK